jgi:hypothetical protein
MAGEVFALRARCDDTIKQSLNRITPPYNAVQLTPYAAPSGGGVVVLGVIRLREPFPDECFFQSPYESPGQLGAISVCQSHLHTVHAISLVAESLHH